MNITIKAFLWDLIGLLGGRVITFVVSIFLARLLTPEDFGLVAMIMVFVGMSQSIADAGFTTALIQAKYVDQTSYSSVFYVNFIISLLLTITLFISAPLISTFYNNDNLLDLTRALSFIYVLNSFNAVQNARLRRNLDFKTQTVALSFSGLLSGSVAVYLAFIGFGVWALVFQVLLSSFFASIITYLLTKWLPIGKFKKDAIRPLWKFGRNLLASSIFESLYQRLDYLFIGKLFTANDLGYYSRSKTTSNLVATLLSSSLLKVFLPTISKIQEDKEKITKLYLKLFEIVALIIFFLSFLLIIDAKELFLLLFGEKWLHSVVYFQLMLLTIWAYPLSALLLNVIKGTGNSKYFFKAEIFKKFLVLPTYAIAYFYGINGYLIATIIVMLPSFYINTFYLHKTIKIKHLPQYKIIFTYILIALISATIPYYYINYDNYLSNLLFKTLIYTFLYVSLIFTFKRKLIRNTIKLIRLHGIR